MTEKHKNKKDNIEAQEMLKVLNEGEEIFLHSDGTWDISVNKWDDAHKVSHLKDQATIEAYKIADELGLNIETNFIDYINKKK